MDREFEKNGYVLFKGFFSSQELADVAIIIEKFHSEWKLENADFYATRAVNSSNITGTDFLSSTERLRLFEFIGSQKLMKVVNNMFRQSPAFMATQLFFNPVNTEQRNYWHRDMQYHLNEAEQQEALMGPDVIHFRIPLFDEPGIEVIPETHKKWDSEQELNVRLEKKGHQCFEDLASGRRIELGIGDLLVFSANMIHRGLYGKERLALDLIFCDPEPHLLKYINADGLPSEKALLSVEQASAFETTLLQKRKAKKV